MSIRNISIGMTSGATIASASLIRRASAIAPLSGSTETRPIGSALSQSNMSDATEGSTPDSARRSRRSWSLIGRSTQRRSSSRAALLE